MKSWYKWVVSISIIVLAALMLFTACGSPAVSPSSTATEVKTKSFIWEISSATTSVYLLGSIHAAKADIYPLDNAIEEAFASSKYLVVEVNVHNVNTDNVNSILMEHGVYPQGRSLQKNIPPSLYDALTDQFKRFNIDMTALNGYRPWVVYNTLEQLILYDLGYLPQNGIDYYFLDKAATTKPILQLETAEYQLELLYSLPDEVMIKSLQYDMDNMTAQEDMEELFKAWENGDITKLESLIFKALTEEPELAPLYEKLYDERNFNMAAKIEGYLADNEVYFIVVGAGHLVGENGLINLLAKKGYAIKQLYNND